MLVRDAAIVYSEGCGGQIELMRWIKSWNQNFKNASIIHKAEDVTRDFVSIDGLRAILTVWVVLFHYERNSSSWTFVRNFLGNGYISVGLFFQLSGFLCVISSSRRWPGAWPFFLKRASRLYPCFWVSVAVGMFAEIGFRPSRESVQWDASLLASLVIVLSAGQAWIPALIFNDTFNGPTWSISCEIFFTGVFVMIYPLLLRISTPRSAWLAWLVTLSLLLAISFVFRALDMHNSPLKFLPVLRAPQFLLGALLGRAHTLSGGSFECLAPYAQLASGAALLGMSIAALLAPPFASNPLYPFYISGLLDPVFSLLLAGLSLAPPPASKVSLHALLSSPPLVGLGRMSYTIYLLQSPIHRLLKRTFNFRGHDDAGCVPLAIFLPALVMGSHLLHWHVERRTFFLATKARLPASGGPPPAAAGNSHCQLRLNSRTC